MEEDERNLFENLNNDLCKSIRAQTWACKRDKKGVTCKDNWAKGPKPNGGNYCILYHQMTTGQIIPKKTSNGVEEKRYDCIKQTKNPDGTYFAS